LEHSGRAISLLAVVRDFPPMSLEPAPLLVLMHIREHP
jgi:hypothetical protein